MPDVDPAQYLRGMCGLKLDACRKALADNDNDPGQALLALVKSEAVSVRKLDPETTPAALLKRAREVADDHFKATFVRARANALGPAPAAPDPQAEQAARRLQALSTFDPDVCRIILKRHDHDPERALAQMIDDRFVLLRHLDPAVVPPALYDRAKSVAAPSERADVLGPAAPAEPTPPPAASASPANETLTLPAFPTLTLDPNTLEGHDTFPSWAGFQDRQGPYSSRSGTPPSAGRADVVFHPPDEDDTTQPRTPHPHQLAAYAHFKSHERQITAAILRSIFDHYPRWRTTYVPDGGYDPDMPPVRAIDDLKRLIGLSTLHVLNVAKDGHAYLGLEIGCTWDQEHATGVLTHRSRILETSSAEISFDADVPLADGGHPITP